MKQFFVGLFCGAMFVSAMGLISVRAEARVRPKVEPRPPPARVLYAGDCGYVEIARTEFRTEVVR